MPLRSATRRAACAGCTSGTLRFAPTHLQGALSGRDFLRRTQAGLKLHRQFEPKTLRWEYQLHIQDKPAEYQAGFLDAIGAYMLTTLEGANQQK